MKKFFTIMILALAVFAGNFAMAGRTDEGTWSTGINFMYDSSSIMGSETTLEFELGYFLFTDNLVGGTFGLELNDVIDTYSFGAKYEYYFDFGSPFVPYVGAGVQLVHASIDLLDDDNTALVGEISLGVKFFVTEAVAVDMAFNAAAATDDVYADDNGLKSENYDFTVGFDFCF